MELKKTPLDRFKAEVKKAANLDAPKDHCVRCKKRFSDKNVFTDAGWREVEITQMCEKCFDEIAGAFE